MVCCLITTIDILYQTIAPLIPGPYYASTISTCTHSEYINNKSYKYTLHNKTNTLSFYAPSEGWVSRCVLSLTSFHTVDALGCSSYNGNYLFMQLQTTLIRDCIAFKVSCNMNDRPICSSFFSSVVALECSSYNGN